MGLVQDDSIDEGDGVAKEPLLQGASDEAHRVDIVRLHQPDPVFAAVGLAATLLSRRLRPS